MKENNTSSVIECTMQAYEDLFVQILNEACQNDTLCGNRNTNFWADF